MPEDQQEQLEVSASLPFISSKLYRKWLPALGAGNPVAFVNTNELPPSMLHVDMLLVAGVFWGVYVKELSLGATRQLRSNVLCVP